MTPAYLRALQEAILADGDCSGLIVLDVPKWVRLPDSMKDPETGLMVVIDAGEHHPDWLPTKDVAARDSAIAEILRGKNWLGPDEATSRSVLAAEARNVLLRRLKWRPIVRKAEEAGESLVHDAAWSAVQIANNAAATIDTRSEPVQRLLDALQQGGLIDAGDREDLEALCAVKSTVTTEAVSRALRGPWGDEQ